MVIRLPFGDDLQCSREWEDTRKMRTSQVCVIRTLNMRNLSKRVISEHSCVDASLQVGLLQQLNNETVLT